MEGTIKVKDCGYCGHKIAVSTIPDSPFSRIEHVEGEDVALRCLRMRVLAKVEE